MRLRRRKTMNNSSLFDETTFYRQFTRDLLRCRHEVVIESPFITSERMAKLYPIFESLIHSDIRVYVFTRDPKEHSNGYQEQSEAEIKRFEQLGVQVFICRGNHHRKLAILDRKVLWEGSLNILSQIKSREIMRRIENVDTAKEMLNFLKFARFINNGAHLV
jgi:phosphatidylserine/phosphatidylglycerophosphate/cardiolipin synthase-like enzyme